MPEADGTLLVRAKKVTVVGRFLAAEGRPANDLSGIASMTPPGARQLDCLVINNEARFGQLARLDLVAMSIEAGATIDLVPDSRGEATAVGRPPVLPPHTHDAGFGILDGEAAAWLAPHYYVTGSHGLIPTTEDYKLSAFLVVRVDPVSRKVQRSFRLSELLTTIPPLSRHFGEKTKAGGIDIEGLAAHEGRLYFGFRAPVLAGRTFILSVSAEALFAEGADLEAAVFRPALGRDTGIRDLAALPDGRLLMICGPVDDPTEDDIFGLRLFDCERRSIVDLGDVSRGRNDKPEGLLLAGYQVHGNGAGTATVLILSDGTGGGDPRVIKLEIPAR